MKVVTGIILVVFINAYSVFASEECKDELDARTCEERALAGYCDQDPDNMKRLCKRACGYCCADQTTLSLNCTKEAKLCDNSKYMKRMEILCPETCGYCATKCDDKIGEVNCFRRAMKGECSANPAFMKENCRRACGYCCADQKTLSPSCKLLASQCNNRQYKKRLQILCPGTCGFCTRSHTMEPCTASKFGCCWDGSTAKNTVGSHDDGCPACKDLYSRGFCRKFADDCDNKFTPGTQIPKLCPATCSVCGTHKKCQDSPDMEFLCTRFKAENQCTRSYHLMKFKCEKTCGYCDKCRDKIPEDICKRNKKFNACTQNYNRMMDLCPATCGFCNRSY